MRQWLFNICLAFLLLTTGCGQTRSKIDQVRLGMTKAEAISVLGKPEGQITGAPQGEMMRWRVEGQEVLLVFNHDKVTGEQVSSQKVP